MSSIIAILFLATVTAGGAPVPIYVGTKPHTIQPSPTQKQELATHSLCVKEILKMEKEKNIPKGLLSSIAKIESGKRLSHKKDTAPWPWVINAGGEGKFFKTRSEAISYVNNLVRQGKKNIDIGCMQISYLHHGHKFDSVSQMFDPATNVAYGAKFLKDLHTEHKSWLKAVGMYHSATLKFQVPYKEKVLKTWQQERYADYKEILFHAKFDKDLDDKILEKGRMVKGGWVYRGNSPLFFMVKGRAPQEELLDQSIHRQQPGAKTAKIIVPRHAPKKLTAGNHTHTRDKPQFIKPIR